MIFVRDKGRMCNNILQYHILIHSDEQIGFRSHPFLCA